MMSHEMDQLYYKNYIINKKIYNTLKTTSEIYTNIHTGGKNSANSREKNKKYFITHSTSYDNLIQILKSKKLYAGYMVSKKYRRLSGSILSKYVFTNLIFNGQKNPNFGHSLIFDEALLYDDSSWFNNGWAADPSDDSIHIDSNESIDAKNEKINTIHDIISRKATETEPCVSMFMRHELLFKKEINLKYLIGIECPGCSKKEVTVIKKLLRNMDRDDVKIYTQMLPTTLYYTFHNSFIL
jgi:hypothetical protein